MRFIVSREGKFWVYLFIKMIFKALFKNFLGLFLDLLGYLTEVVCMKLVIYLKYFNNTYFLPLFLLTGWAGFLFFGMSSSEDWSISAKHISKCTGMSFITTFLLQISHFSVRDPHCSSCSNKFGKSIVAPQYEQGLGRLGQIVLCRPSSAVSTAVEQKGHFSFLWNFSSCSAFFVFGIVSPHWEQRHRNRIQWTSCKVKASSAISLLLDKIYQFLHFGIYLGVAWYLRIAFLCWHAFEGA